MQLLIDNDDDITERAEALEMIIDAYGLAETLSALAIICNEKASHVQENWQDNQLARQWSAYSNKLDTIAAHAYRIDGFHK